MARYSSAPQGGSALAWGSPFSMLPPRRDALDLGGVLLTGAQGTQGVSRAADRRARGLNGGWPNRVVQRCGEGDRLWRGQGWLG